MEGPLGQTAVCEEAGGLGIVENYANIFYLDCPHFTVGHVDQWGEQGYLLHAGKVYSYDEDRKNQYGTTTSPMTIPDFLAYAERSQIDVPDEFLKKLREANENE